MNGMALTRESHRDARSFRWIDDLRQDVRYAVRGFARTPAFSLAVILTFALGIGANIAIFSVVYGVLLRPLPYRDADRLVIIQREQDMAGTNRPVPVTFFEPDALDVWGRGLGTFASAALYSVDVAALTTAEGSELLDASIVSGGFFPTMNGPIVAGRGIVDAEDSSPVAVISERLAERLYGSAADAIDRQIVLTSRTHTIVGVTARDFRFPEVTTDVWMPAGYARSVNPRCCGFRLIGRLEPDASVEQTAAAASALARSQVRPVNADGGQNRTDVRATAVSLHDASVTTIRPALLVMMAAAGLTLLVACANIANLFLARRAARTREISTRIMLGASRGRLAAQAATESALIAAAGAIAGVALAKAGVTLLTRVGAQAIPRVDDIRLDVPVLAFAAGIAALAALLTGLLPVMQRHADTRLPPTGLGVTTAPGGSRLRRALCVAELVVSLVLLVGASLLGRSLITLMRTDLGVAAEGVVTASMNFGMGGSRRTDADVLWRTGEIVSALERLPGVSAAGVGTSLPPGSTRLQLTLRRDGESVDYLASGVAATPGYFEALGMRLVRGRLFTPQDDLDHPPVMIMSVDTARRLFGDGDPIGQTMSLPVVRDGTNASERMTLVGVVDSVRYSGLDSAPDDAVYRPFAQQTWAAPFLVVRTSSDPQALAASLRRHVGDVDRSIVISEVRTLSSIVSDAAAQPRFRTVLLGGMAALAVGLAGVGLYGVIAYSVSQRTRELGVRVALGATRGDILRLVLADALRLALSGIVVGGLAAAGLATLIGGLLYGIEPWDPLSFTAAALLLLAVTTIASYLPARRALQIDPVDTLRSE